MVLARRLEPVTSVKRFRNGFSAVLLAVSSYRRAATVVLSRAYQLRFTWMVLATLVGPFVYALAYHIWTRPNCVGRPCRSFCRMMFLGLLVLYALYELPAVTGLILFVVGLIALQIRATCDCSATMFYRLLEIQHFEQQLRLDSGQISPYNYDDDSDEYDYSDTDDYY